MYAVKWAVFSLGVKEILQSPSAIYGLNVSMYNQYDTTVDFFLHLYDRSEWCKSVMHEVDSPSASFTGHFLTVMHL